MLPGYCCHVSHVTISNFYNYYKSSNLVIALPIWITKYWITFSVIAEIILGSVVHSNLIVVDETFVYMRRAKWKTRCFNQGSAVLQCKFARFSVTLQSYIIEVTISIRELRNLLSVSSFMTRNENVKLPNNPANTKNHWRQHWGARDFHLPPSKYQFHLLKNNWLKSSISHIILEIINCWLGYFFFIMALYTLIHLSFSHVWFFVWSYYKKLAHPHLIYPKCWNLNTPKNIIKSYLTKDQVNVYEC